MSIQILFILQFIYLLFLFVFHIGFWVQVKHVHINYYYNYVIHSNKANETQLRCQVAVAHAKM